MNFKFCFSVCLSLLALLFVGCGQDFEPQQEAGSKNKLRIQFDFPRMTDVVVRSTTAGTQDEDKVESLLVVFFDASGNKVKFSNQQQPYFYYNVASPTAIEWVDGNPATNTVILPIAPAEALDKTVVVVANAPAELRTALTSAAGTNEIKTKAQLDAYKAKVIDNADAIEHPFLMRGEKSVTATIIPDVTKVQTIPVDLERAIARIDFVIHYDWEKLVPDHETERGYRQLQLFDQETYVGLQNAITGTRVNGTRTELPKTNESAPRAVTTFTEYINEYALADDNAPAVKSPHVVLELPAVLGKQWAADNPPYFPPPAGGDPKDFDTTPVKNFYKIVMPRTIKRNHYCRVHVYIIGPGGADEDSAVNIDVKFTVLPWQEGGLVVKQKEDILIGNINGYEIKDIDEEEPEDIPN